MSAHGQCLAAKHPDLIVNTITPGFIDTAMTAGFGATKKPEEGTVSIRHCLHKDLAGNGWFYGSDAQRSPLYPSRDPGTKPFDGTYPWTP